MTLAQDLPFHPVPADRIIMESSNCMALYDNLPQSRGHALVIPNWSVFSLFELHGEVRAELWHLVRLVREVLKTRFNPDGFIIGVSDGQVAGQTVHHAHVHIIPRYGGDVRDPQGGIRRIIPEEATYWEDAGGEKTVEVLGIDVGVTKGLHVIALSLINASETGPFTILGNGISVEEAVAICLRRTPACIAIDSPPAWALAGNARGGEQELRRLGIHLYATPSDPAKQSSNFYAWMKVGFSVFEGLQSQYPLYREGVVGRHALEVFPHATAVALACRHRAKGTRKTVWRKQVLTANGFEVSGLRNADCVDAALAAVTAAHALRGSFSAFGNPQEGVIVTPYPDAASRFRAARRPVGVDA